ncbi:MAG: DUF5678 domain-containing protein [Thermotogota bacterium]|nr:DUF5678 domain-containing protein [Thermotogota bacterium]
MSQRKAKRMVFRTHLHYKYTVLSMHFDGEIKWRKRNYLGFRKGMLSGLKKKYDNRWIMIHGGKVIESASTFNEIMNVARKYDPNSILVEYVQSKPIAMFF